MHTYRHAVSIKNAKMHKQFHDVFKHFDRNDGEIKEIVNKMWKGPYYVDL